MDQEAGAEGEGRNKPLPVSGKIHGGWAKKG
jgi:hypothetical protein